VNLFYNVAPTLPSALSDDQGVGATAAADLIGRWYRSFGFVGLNTSWSRDRCDGFTAALSRAGHSCFICPTATSVNDFHFMETRRAGKMIERWLAGLPRPVAILACADPVARTVLGACENIGIGVPHEAAILGVDNRVAICELARVPLSSVMQDFKRLGFEAARLLDQTMRRRARAGRAVLVPPGTVVTRRSTEALAFEDPHISTAMRLIHQQIATGISIKELLRHIPVSRKWLDLQFKAVIGRTPSQEIRKLRLAAIRDMLIKTDLGIRQIAQRCGFSNAENMIRFFRDAEGVPPQRFRERQRSDSRL
jgi:LacI family transcriptional regulator